MVLPVILIHINYLYYPWLHRQNTSDSHRSLNNSLRAEKGRTVRRKGCLSPTSTKAGVEVMGTSSNLCPVQWKILHAVKEWIPTKVLRLLWIGIFRPPAAGRTWVLSSDNCCVSHTSCMRQFYSHAEMQVATLQCHVTKHTSTAVTSHETHDKHSVTEDQKWAVLFKVFSQHTTD